MISCESSRFTIGSNISCTGSGGGGSGTSTPKSPNRLPENSKGKKAARQKSYECKSSTQESQLRDIKKQQNIILQKYSVITTDFSTSKQKYSGKTKVQKDNENNNQFESIKDKQTSNHNNNRTDSIDDNCSSGLTVTNTKSSMSTNNIAKDDKDRTIANLETELKTKESEVTYLEAELRSSQRKYANKDAECSQKDREIHKLKSVLQQAANVMTSKDKENNDEGKKNLLLTTLQEQYSGIATQRKKEGVSGQSLDPKEGSSLPPKPKAEKDFRSKQLIREAIMENDFLKLLPPNQVREIVDYMEKKKVVAGAYVIKEGDQGSHLYVSAEGDYEVIKDGKVLGQLGIGKAFGELAILYNCRRTASIRAISNGEVWLLDRIVFQKIMMSTGKQRLADQVKFLKAVPLLKNLPDEVLNRLSDAFELVNFSHGDYIVRQGTSGDTFYIISEGQVRVTRRVEGKKDEEEIRFLSRGDYFGEQALLKTDFRTANVIGNTKSVECLMLDRESFFQLVGDMDELKKKDYPELNKMKTLVLGDKKVSKEFENLRLNDLEILATLGVGGFGRVELVQLAKKVGDKAPQTFALKCLKKKHIVDTQQQDHVYSEKKIMMNCKHQFITSLYRTFKDRKYVYLLMEACLGGELWTILRDKGWFDDQTTRFYVACVISAVDYLHSQGIIYRDLKPENLLLDASGYVKMVDFGFSKVIKEGSKTWTFCGTPEYVAPEIILNRGHDRAVDFWSLGVLMCELLMGTPPFTASDPMKIYNIILRGIDQIHFPRHVTKTAITIIKRFCKESPAERLGYQKNGIDDIKSHRWFQGFHWEGLESKTLTPPCIPKIKSQNDSSNFDNYPRDVDNPPDELSGWDEMF